MFHDARRPSVMTFAGLCGPSPSSFITSASPTTPRRFWTSPSRPSVITFARLHRASPSSFINSTLPARSEGSGRHLQASDIDEFRMPPTSGIDHLPCFSQIEWRNDPLTVSECHDLWRTFRSRHLRQGAIPNTTPGSKQRRIELLTFET